MEQPYKESNHYLPEKGLKDIFLICFSRFVLSSLFLEIGRRDDIRFFFVSFIRIYVWTN